MKPDKRAEVEFRKELVDYLMRSGMARAEKDRFVGAASERFHSIVFNTYMLCEEEGVKSVYDPRFDRILNSVESLYPTWDEMRDAIVRGWVVVLPNGYKF